MLWLMRMWIFTWLGNNYFPEDAWKLVSSVVKTAWKCNSCSSDLHSEPSIIIMLTMVSF